jgi:phosphatidylinositol alpha 1,6-mannosyltransferase
VKVLIVTESFLPAVNGVTNSVCRVVEYLHRRGHRVHLLAPSPAVAEYDGARVERLPAVPFPGYAQVRIGVAGTARLRAAIAAARPDVVYLASPFQLGLPAVRAAAQLGVPTLAVFQTDVAGFATRYGRGAARLASPMIWRRVDAIHHRVQRTLAPSPSAVQALRQRGIPQVHLWRRGVDGVRFDPRRRDDALRRRLAPHGEVLVGYVGRLAPEKQLDDLSVLSGLPGVRLVVVGDGPDRSHLRRRLPDAAFLGFLDGDALPRAVASLDVMVHPGPHETFCQAVQEALACGVPVVAVARGGPRDLVQHEQTGLLYEPGDLAGLRHAVLGLARDPDRLRRLAAQARPSVVARTWERTGDQLLAHLRVLTAGGARAALPMAA